MAALPRLVEFEHLPPQTRKRLADATKRLGYPQPILADTRTGGAPAVIWVLLAFLGLFILVVAAVTGFGSVYRYHQSPLANVTYFAGFALLVGGGLALVRSILRGRTLPFSPGVYVFPSDMIDARTKTLRIVPLAELVDARPFTPTQLVLRFADGSWHTFPVFGPQAAHQALYAIHTARAHVAQAADYATRAALDPLIDARAGDAFQPGRPEDGLRAHGVPAWTRFGWAIALGAGVVLGVPTWLVRNLLSDDSAFAKAKGIDETYEYEGYLEGHGRHSDEVATRLLPHAALEAAKKEKTVAAMKEFLAKYPHSFYDADAQKALEDAYRYELAQAKEKGTVTALRDFVKAYPEADVVPEAKAAIHALFEKTLADFQKQASDDDPAMMPFVKALLAYLEAHDSPPIAVHFKRKNADSLGVADRLLLAAQADDPSAGGVATASGHFDAKHSRPREDAIVTSLQNGFVRVFPTDVLTLKNDATGDTAAKPPTMDIAYEVGWSGTTYHGDTSDRDFVGIVITFNVEMNVPGAPAAKRCPPTPPKPWEHPAPEVPGALCPLKFSLEVRPPQHFTVSYESLAPEFRTDEVLGGPSDEQVYDVMAARAFDELATKVMAVFFEKHTGEAKKQPAANQAAAPADDDDDEGTSL